MSGHHPPLTCAEFEAVLTKLGFIKRARKTGTTHDHWVATIGDRFRKVTVDGPNAPFSQDLITSMANQAGVSKKTIYDIHFGRVSAEEKVEIVAVPKRFEARRQADTEFWCVWDTQIDALAFNGTLMYLTEADAIARADHLSLK